MWGSKPRMTSNADLLEFGIRNRHDLLHESESPVGDCGLRRTEAGENKASNDAPSFHRNVRACGSAYNTPLGSGSASQLTPPTQDQTVSVRRGCVERVVCSAASHQ